MATKDISNLQICCAIVARDYLRDRDLKWLGMYPRLDAILETMTGQCNKVVWSALHRASHQRYTDYGVNARGSWMEPKGKQLLKDAPAASCTYEAYRVGDLVSRAGDDVQILIDLNDVGDLGTFFVIVAPAIGWIQQGETETNTTARYSPLTPTTAAPDPQP